MNSRCRLSRHSKDFSAFVADAEYFSVLVGDAEDDVVVVDDDREDRVFIVRFFVCNSCLVGFWFKSFCF